VSTLVTTANAASAGTARKGRRFALLRHSAVLAKRGLINTLRTPEALIDVTLQPIIFLLLFTYVFGGRSRAARSTTTCSSCSPASSPRRSPWAAWRSA
jgi:oleandomycin transport system permease protein